MILGRQPQQGVAGLDGVVLRRSHLLCNPFSLRTLLFFGLVNLLLFILGFRVVPGGIGEILALEHEVAVAESAALEIYQPLRIERVSLVTGLEVQMRTGGAAGRTSEADHIPRGNILPRLHLAFREMGVGCLQAGCVADHHHIAVAAVIHGAAHLAVERGIHRHTCRQGQIHPGMIAAAAPSERRKHLDLTRHAEAAGGICQAERHLPGEILQLAAVRIQFARLPVIAEHGAVCQSGDVPLVVPGAVVHQKNLHGGIGGVEGIVHGRLLAGNHGLDRLAYLPGHEFLCLLNSKATLLSTCHQRQKHQKHRS